MRKKLTAFLALMLIMAASITAKAQNYLTFTAVDGDAQFWIGSSNANRPSIEYSSDKINWSALEYNEYCEIPNGESVYLRGNNATISESSSQYTYFGMEGGKIEASGSVMSLLDGEGNSETITSPYCFCGLFQNCDNLTKAPELPATQLTQGCYYQMFGGCTSLAEAPELPATELADYCYKLMFSGCTSLPKAPALPSAELKEGCYASMFQSCSSLSYIEAGFTDWGSDWIDEAATHSWTYSVNSEGTFIKPESLAETRNRSILPIMYSNNIPVSWEVQNKYDGNFLTLKAVGGDARIGIRTYGNCDFPNIESSRDKITWTKLESAEDFYDIPEGDSIFLRGNNETISNSGADYAYFSMSGKGNIEASGSVMSLLDGVGKSTVIESDYCFSGLFQYCSNLIKAPDLPATELTVGCYKSMFSGCTSLTQASDLPATELAEGCYCQMFNNCPKLTQAPELPATKLAANCYQSIFSGCTNLKSAPELPATKLATYCYGNMFSECTSLKEAPDLPATELAAECYQSMFSGCESLKSAPDLPATELRAGCYESMFSNCTNLKSAPELPATELAAGCYESMFSNCTNLKSAPELPATKLATYCYWNMFSECTSLAQAPDLPATKLADNCYQSMFLNCSSLHQIKVGFTQWHDNATSDWVKGVADDGAFIGPESLSVSKNYGADGIPEGWETFTIAEEYGDPLEGDFLTLTASSDDASFGLSLASGSEGLLSYEQAHDGTHNVPDIQFSFDKKTWYRLYISSDNLVEIGNGSSVFLKGNNESLGNGSEYSQFEMTGQIAASGSIMSPLGKDIVSDYCFSGLFRNCASLTSAPELPATTLAPYCYQSMFEGCSNLKEAPELPAQELPIGCYARMFIFCSNLNILEVMFERWDDSATQDWVKGVETSHGSFSGPQSLPEIYSDSHIPTLWNPGGAASIEQTRESIEQGACPGSTAEIGLIFSKERPDFFKVEGIHDDWQAWDSDTESAIKIPVPDSPDKFGLNKYSIAFQYANGSSPNPFEAQITINYPSRYIGVIYEDILFVDNHEGIFQQYQWLSADGSEIDGATGQFLHVKSLSSSGGIFSTKIKTQTGSELRICPLTVEPAQISKSLECGISAYPNPIYAGDEITMELHGFDDAVLDGCTVSIYSSAGVLAQQLDGSAGLIKTSLPQGQYSIVAVSGSVKRTFKITVK